MKKREPKTKGITVLWVDDDRYFLSHVAEMVHRNLSWQVIQAASPSEAVEQLKTCHATVSFVICDVMMSAQDFSDEMSTRGGFLSGVVLARQIRATYPTLPIYGCSSDRRLAEWFIGRPKMGFIPKREVFDDVRVLQGLIDRQRRSRIKPKCFIVHGHDEKIKLQLKNFLQNTLKLGQPIILHEQPNMGKTILEKFEDTAQGAELVFVLLTPDDLPGGPTDPNSDKMRARQNVIFELGYFLGMLKRRSGRVLLLNKGQLELPSDISGLVYVDVSNGIEPASEAIRKELSEWLC